MVNRRPAASISIEAPLATVWAVMLDTAAYAAWNPFVERVETRGPAAVGTPLVLYVRWSNGSTARSPERITVLDAPATGADGVETATLAYAYEGFAARLGLLRGTRHQRLTQRPGGRTEYDTVEEFSGPLVRLAGPGRVAEGFARHAAALKERAESRLVPPAG